MNRRNRKDLEGTSSQVKSQGHLRLQRWHIGWWTGYFRAGTAVCWNVALEECQEEVVLWSSIAALQLLPR